MKEYNKLIRDKIPEIITSAGKDFSIRTASETDVLSFLTNKLDEEVLEFKEDNSAEELADILEVVFGLASKLGLSEDELLAIRNEKLLERGGFEDNIILEWVK